MAERLPIGLPIGERAAMTYDRDAICDVIESSLDMASVADWVIGLLNEARADGWDDGAEFMDADTFWHYGGRESNPYRSEVYWAWSAYCEAELAATHG